MPCTSRSARDLGTGADHSHRRPDGSGLDIRVLDGSTGSAVLIDEHGGVIRYQERVLTGGQESTPSSGEWQHGAVRYHLMANGECQHLFISAGVDDDRLIGARGANMLMAA